MSACPPTGGGAGRANLGFRFAGDGVLRRWGLRAGVGGYGESRPFVGPRGRWRRGQRAWRVRIRGQAAGEAHHEDTLPVGGPREDLYRFVDYRCFKMFLGPAFAGFSSDCACGLHGEFCLRCVPAEDSYPNETKRAELSVQLGLTDRQLQMWFCHRRLKDRKPPAKRQQLRDEEVSIPAIAPLPPPPVLPQPLPPSEMMVGAVGTYGDQMLPYSRRGPGRSSAVPRISVPEIGRRYYEPPQVMLPHMATVHLTQAELRVIDSVEALIGEPLRKDGPVLGIEFDPLPPGAFGAPIGNNLMLMMLPCCT